VKVALSQWTDSAQRNEVTTCEQYAAATLALNWPFVGLCGRGNSAATGFILKVCRASQT